MKNVLIILFFVIGFSQVSFGQEIGVRFGDTVGGNVAIDGVFAFKKSRIHADVSFGNGGLGVVGVYDFIVSPLGDEAFNWYLGVGASAFLGDPFELGIPGEIGLEYRFDNVPIALGIDWRPTFILIENTDFKIDRFGLNVRFVLAK
ncbi:MAG: outer membrane insertion C- signal [Bacteroidetes bacterium]|nr:outer membrane insertion C- signal [Bacteroidota bacterium]